jgi:hypothetical protein
MSQSPNEVVVKRLVVWPAYDYTTDDGATPRFLFGYDPSHPEIPIFLKLGAVDNKELMIPGASFQIEIASTSVLTGPAISTYAVRAGDKFASFRIPDEFVGDLRNYVMSVSVSVSPDANNFGEPVYVDFAAYEKPRATDDVGEFDLSVELEILARQQAQILETVGGLAEYAQTSTASLGVLQETLNAVAMNQTAELSVLGRIRALFADKTQPPLPARKKSPSAVRTDADLAWNWVWIGGILIIAIGVAVAILKL